MMPEQLEKYRDLVTLADGARVLLRPMTLDDHSFLNELFISINDDDLRYFRHNVKDPKILKEWIDSLDYNDVIPILALVKERPVGNATLHFGKGPRRHIGEIRIYLSREFRKRGLGMKILRTIIEFGRKQGLQILIAEVIAENVKLIKAFEAMGFKQQCTLENYFMFPDGECIDVKLMVMPLTEKVEEF